MLSKPKLLSVFTLLFFIFTGSTGCAYRGEIQPQQKTLDMSKLTSSGEETTHETPIKTPKSSEITNSVNQEKNLENDSNADVNPSRESTTRNVPSSKTLTEIPTDDPPQDISSKVDNETVRANEVSPVREVTVVDSNPPAANEKVEEDVVHSSPSTSKSFATITSKSSEKIVTNETSNLSMEQDSTASNLPLVKKQEATEVEETTSSETTETLPENKVEITTQKTVAKDVPLDAKTTKTSEPPATIKATPVKEVPKVDIWWQLHEKLIKKTGTYHYKILVDGTQRGTRTIEIRNPTKTKVVANVVDDIKVSLILFNAYEYRHSSTEVWESGRLTKVDSFTNKNGEVKTVSMSLSGEEFVSQNGKKRIPAPVSSTKAWNFYEIYTFQPKMDLINTEDGGARRNEVVWDKKDKLTIAGSMLPCHILKYKQGDCHLWYSETGILLKRRTVEDGREVVFLLESWN